MLSEISFMTCGIGRCRTAAIRCAWMSALACEMSGSTPEAVVLTASTGTFETVRLGSYGFSSAR